MMDFKIISRAFIQNHPHAFISIRLEMRRRLSTGTKIEKEKNDEKLVKIAKADSDPSCFFGLYLEN